MTTQGGLTRQRQLWARCLHPTGDFVPFEWRDVAQSLAARFEQQVCRGPDRIAIDTHAEALTYDRLNRLANRIARTVTDQLGMRSEPVALVFEPGAQVVASILGVLKSAKIYLPLDPRDPPARLRQIIRESGARAIVTNDRHRDLVHELARAPARVQTVNIDELDSNVSEENLGLVIPPDAPASLYYTSGSTGRPKGVVETHRNRLVNALRQTNCLHICADDRLSLLHAPRFSGSVNCLFGGLLNNATLLPFDVGDQGTTRLGHWLQRQEVTIYHSVPSVFRQLAAALDDCASLPHLRLVLLAGDAVFQRDVELFRKRFPATCLLANAWGVTESPLFRPYFIGHDGQPQPTTPAVGWSSEDEEILLFDGADQPLAFGQTGEIVLRSRYLSPGYWGDDASTAEKFRTDPSTPTKRLYFTGDLACRLPDGSLVYKGRKDSQVTVRGVRVELGEIESTLLGHDNVRDAVVLAIETRLTEKRLVACVVPHGRPAGLERNLRIYLATRLPSYMLPGQFVWLHSIPRARSGKVDRRALQAAVSGSTNAGRRSQTPRTVTEQKLAALFERHLGLTGVPIDDQYYALGGDSLAALNIVADAAKAGLHLTPQQLFEHPTVAELARVVRTEDVRPGAHPQGVERGSVPLTPAHVRFLVERESPDLDQWNASVLLETPPGLNTRLLRSALTHLFHHHDAFRLRFSRSRVGWTAQLSEPTNEIPFEHRDLSSVSPARRGAHFRQLVSTLQSSLDLTKGPVIRFVHFNLGSAGHRLLFCVHHLVADGVSWQILLTDLESACAQLARGHHVRLPSRTTSVKQWAERLREHEQTSELQQHATYWMSRPWSRVQPIPRDFPGTALDNSNFSACEVRVSLGSQATARLLRPRTASTFQSEDRLAAALACALSAWARHRVVLFDRIGHGRTAFAPDIDLSRTVGFFLSYTPLVLSVPIRDEPGQLDTLMAAIQKAKAHEMSFDLLRYRCSKAGVADYLSATPRSQVSFNFRGRTGPTVKPNALFAPARESIETSNFSPRALRYYPLGVVVDVVSRELDIRFVYTRSLYRRETVRKLAVTYLRQLAVFADVEREI